MGSSPVIPLHTGASKYRRKYRRRFHEQNQSAGLSEGVGRQPRLASAGFHGMGGGPGEQGLQAPRAPGIHVYAARRDHGSVLAEQSREFSIIAAPGLGIPAPGA